MTHCAVAEGGWDLLIFDNGLLWQTVSNADNKSIAMQTGRSGGFLWLNPTEMYVVNCSRAEVVECSRLKPCWSLAGGRYLLIPGKSRDSRLERVLMYSIAEMLQVEDAELVMVKCQTISIALDCLLLS